VLNSVSSILNINLAVLIEERFSMDFSMASQWSLSLLILIQTNNKK
jgi:hypothetical protein